MLAPLSFVERKTLSALMAKVMLSMFERSTEEHARGDLATDLCWSG
jgi:hypothetical protein